MKVLKLNLGAGYDKRKGFVNIDAVAAVKPDLLHDLHTPLPFENETVQEILAQDILEHFTKEDVQHIISEISRVLKVGGTVKVRVPNIEDIIERFAWNKDTRNEFLYGTTKHTGIFGAHKVGFTPEMMVRFFLEYGLELLCLQTTDTNYRFVFQKKQQRPQLPTVYALLDQIPDEIDTKSIFHTTEIQREHNENLQSFSVSLLRFPVQVWRVFFINQHRTAELLVGRGFWNQLAVALVGYANDTPVVWIEDKDTARFLLRFFSIPKFLYYLVKSIPDSILVFDEQTKNTLIAAAHIDLSKIEIIEQAQSKKKRSQRVEQEIVRAQLRHTATKTVRTHLS